jgi:DNA-binding Lrp family transcriptional regulator
LEIIDVQAANYDLITKARFQSLKKLDNFIQYLRNIEGIQGTSTAIITEEYELTTP